MGQRGARDFRRRWPAWWGLAAVALAGVEAPRGHAAPADRGCRLRVACFNAEILAVPGENARLTRFRFEPARRRHLERIAAVIETLDPDVLVMPEVVSQQGVAALAAILAEKGLGDLVGYHVENADLFSGLDVAVFSRFEPEEIEGARIRIFVPRKPADGEEPIAADAWLEERFKYMDERGNARAETAVLQRHAVVYLTVCGRKLAIFGLHLKSNPSDIGSNAQRTAEARIARDIIRKEIEGRGYLPILLGDLNDYDPDVPMADASRQTATNVLRDLKDYDPDREGAELVNVAAHMPRVADRYTSHWDFNENGVPDGDDVFTMIDHILVHRDLEPAIRRAFICHATGLEISDHFPVVVDFDLAALKRKEPR